MVSWNIQRVKVVIVGFNLWPIEHAESHRREELLNLVLHLRYRMNVTGRDALRRDGKVNPLGLKALVRF